SILRDATACTHTSVRRFAGPTMAIGAIFPAPRIPTTIVTRRSNRQQVPDTPERPRHPTLRCVFHPDRRPVVRWSRTHLLLRFVSPAPRIRVTALSDRADSGEVFTTFDLSQGSSSSNRSID